MKVFLDTSVLVAAAYRGHTHHAPAAKVVAALKPGEGFCAQHSLAEFYVTMTSRTRVGVAIPLELVVAAVRELVRSLSAVTLSVPEFTSMIERAAGAGVSGASVYDALILRCAEKVDADIMFTFNTAHFHRFAKPDWIAKIQAP